MVGLEAGGCCLSVLAVPLARSLARAAKPTYEKKTAVSLCMVVMPDCVGMLSLVFAGACFIYTTM